MEECISRTSIEKHHQSIITHIENSCVEKPKKAKQLYSAMILFNQPDIHEPLQCFQTMKDLIHVHNKNDMILEEKQELTPAQKRSYLNWKEIIKVRDNLSEQIKPLWSSTNLSDIIKIQNYVIACVYTMIPPRRLLDYVVMSKYPAVGFSDNGITKRDGKLYFVFSHYKTASCYGQQVIDIPMELQTVLSKWMDINPSCNLFFYKSVELRFNVKQFQRQLAMIFGKPGFGVNILRHAFISDQVLANMPYIEDLKTIASQMGHSTQQQILYKKHN